MTEGKPFNVEVTTRSSGVSKWVKDVVSHTPSQVREARDAKETITLRSKDGGETDVDMGDVTMIRFQDSETFERRSKRVQGDDRHGSDKKAG